jgi:protein FAM32A
VCRAARLRCARGSDRPTRRASSKEEQLIKKKIAKSYRQRVEEYNAYLNSLSEHHDIPKVGPG